MTYFQSNSNMKMFTAVRPNNATYSAYINLYEYLMTSLEPLIEMLNEWDEYDLIKDEAHWFIVNEIEYSLTLQINPNGVWYCLYHEDDALIRQTTDFSKIENFLFKLQ